MAMALAATHGHGDRRTESAPPCAVARLGIRDT